MPVLVLLIVNQQSRCMKLSQAGWLMALLLRAVAALLLQSAAAAVHARNSQRRKWTAL